MKRPYTFHFDTSCEKIAHERPAWSSFRFPKAQKTRHFVLDSAEMVSQKLNFRPFYIELFEFNNKADFEMRYEVSEEQHFLFFILAGEMSFRSDSGFFVSHARHNHFAMTYNNTGVYRVKMKAGMHTALCVAMHQEWLAFATTDLPVLRDYLSRVDTARPEHAMLPYCPMSTVVRNGLREIRSLIASSVGSVDGFLRLYMSRILEEYNRLAIEKLTSLPYMVARYLEEHFKDSALNAERIVKYFGKSERSLRNQFKTEFDITMREYYTSLRIQYASRLMKEQNRPISEVFHEAGYNDESTFRYELKKFQL